MKNRLDFRAQLSRHSHDVSAGFSSSLTTGPLVPQYFHMMNPGDKIYFQQHMFARLQDVVTAFLGEIDVHLQGFFVPLQMLYTPFGQVFAQTDDLISSLFNQNAFTDDGSFPQIGIDASILDQKQARSMDNINQDSWLRDVFRLFDSLDVNPLAVVSQDVRTNWGLTDPSLVVPDELCHNPAIVPWIFAAYQAIYQKCFRNDEFERLDVSSYNFDNFYSDLNFASSKFISLRFSQRPSDYFTSARVSPISSAVNSLGFVSDGAQFPSDGGVLSSELYKVESFLDSANLSVYPFGTEDYFYATNVDKSFDTTTSAFKTSVPPTTSLNASFSASNIRTLFAVDKFARIYGRADKTYDDQILAHFGIKIPHDVKHDITRICDYRMVLQSDPIYGTANVTDSENNNIISALGQVGGQGSVDFNSKQDSFVAPVHGVFMILAFAVCKPRYIGTFSKLHLLNNRLSFPIPEFDKLGPEPLYRFEVHPISLSNTGFNLMSNRIGWIDRYSSFKKKYNRTSFTYYHGDYAQLGYNFNSYGPWVISRLPFGFSLNDTSNIPQTDATSHFVRATAFFEDVTSLNNIMVKHYDRGFSESYFDAPHMILQNDPILTEYMCNAKLVSWMSETGEPDL